MRNHRVVDWIGVLEDVESFLNDPSRVGEKRPVRANSTTIFIPLNNIVAAHRDQLVFFGSRQSLCRSQSIQAPRGDSDRKAM